MAGRAGDFEVVLTYKKFLEGAAQRGEAVNTMFEERMFGLVESMQRITDALDASQIPYEVIGGLAVLIHVEEANPEYSALTRDVDLMVRREDLERVKKAAAGHGFRFRHAAGVDMLIYSASNHAKDAIHLVFANEKVRPDYLSATPVLRPDRKRILGKDVLVIPVADLVRMKLTSFRLKDQVHVKALESAGLVTREVEAELPPELIARLQQTRLTE